MKLFDLLLLLAIGILFKASFVSANPYQNHSSNSQDYRLKSIFSRQYLVEEIYFDFLGSTKMILKNKNNNSKPFTLYLNPHKSYQNQFDLVDKAQNSSKIISHHLLVLDLASPIPYATLQSN